MKRQDYRTGSTWLVAVTAAACLMQRAQAVDAPADRLAAIRKAGLGASITVFPAVLGEKPMSQVGDVVGMFFEKAGMDNIETSEVAAKVSPGADPAEMTAQFGKFVRDQRIKTEYAMYVEFIGTHQTGFTEVRSVIVDKTGAEVWSDRQTKSDMDFKRIAPHEPMQCCMLVAERVKGALKLPEPPAGHKEPGKIEKRFSEKAGMPSDAERSAMKPRLAALKQLGANAAIEVYPVQINGKADEEAARQLVKLLGDATLCKPQLAKSSPVFEFKPTMNEQTMLWNLARAGRSQAKAHRPAAAYALFAEYLMNPKESMVGGVHFVLCDQAGEWVIVDFQNNHWEDFNSIAPHTTDDCGKLVVRRLKGYIK